MYWHIIILEDKLRAVGPFSDEGQAIHEMFLMEERQKIPMTSMEVYKSNMRYPELALIEWAREHLGGTRGMDGDIGWEM